MRICYFEYEETQSLKRGYMQKSKYLISHWTLFTIVFFSPLLLNAKSINSCDLRNSEALKINSFDHCTQMQLDQYYLSLKTGTQIPNGVFNGKVQIGNSQNFKKFLSSFNHEAEEYFLERLWRGKSFSQTHNNQSILFNRIIKNYPMFPAHVYFGKSLFDSDQPSIVIDYKNNQDIEGYRPAIDWLVNENGLAIRDEIRKVRNGLYLGRAYVKDKFLLNFVLESTL
jgi:hypothetical protein